MTTLLLEARDLHFSYPGGITALRGLDLRVERRRRLAILGPNGSGKTTLMLHLNGTLKPTAGEVMLEGTCPGYGRTALRQWRQRVGVVFQDPDDMLFAATVAEDVSFGPRNQGLDEGQTHDRVAAALAALHIEDLADRATHMLSFGQKKRVAIAGVVVMQPEVLILDEPTAGLDSRGTALLMQALAALEQQGTSLVFATHDVDHAYAWAEQVALFQDGQVLAQGAATEILSDRELLAGVGMQPPTLLDMALRLQEKGRSWPTDGPPRDREAFVRWIGD
ncbi:ATP-binding cassette domain-containing protein [Magnetospira thiophila]